MNKTDLLNAAYDNINNKRTNIRKILYTYTGIETPDPDIERIEANKHYAKIQLAKQEKRNKIKAEVERQKTLFIDFFKPLVNKFNLEIKEHDGPAYSILIEGTAYATVYNILLPIYKDSYQMSDKPIVITMPTPKEEWVFSNYNVNYKINTFYFGNELSSLKNFNFNNFNDFMIHLHSCVEAYLINYTNYINELKTRHTTFCSDMNTLLTMRHLQNGSN